jgi:hypothetical protein
MRSYFVKLNGREEGPFSDSQIAQLFADRRVDRNTPCRLANETQWRTIDDHLPTLKYGTELPPKTPMSRAQPASRSGVTVDGTVITDINLPFGSVLKLMFQSLGASLIVALCLAPIVALFWFVLFAVLAAIFGHALSGLPHK